jgi:hypothetical protein
MRSSLRARRAVARILVLPLAFAALLGAYARRSAAAPETIVRVFTLKYRRAEDAFVALRPLLSDSVEVSTVLETRLNSLTVRGTPARIEQVSRAIAAFDVPLRAIDIAVTLLRSSAPRPREPGEKSAGRAGERAPEGAGERTNVSEEIRGIGEKLKKLFNVTDFTRLDSVVVQGIEGQRVAYVMGGGYRLEFLLDPSRDGTQVQLRDLSLERVRHEAGKEIRGEILRTSINVSLGQPYILGVGRDESAGDKLFVVFFANWRPQPGPGIFLN